MSRLTALTVGQAVVGLLALSWIVALDDVGMPALVPFAVFTGVLLALTLLPPVYVELRRHGAWLTLADGASVVGLFLLGPVGLLAAVALTEIVVLARVRQAPLKRLVNLVTMLSGASVGIALFAALGFHDPARPEAWSAAFATLVVIATYDLLLSTAVIASAEQQPWRDMVASVAPAQVVSLAVACAFGFTALILVLVEPWSLALLVPLLALLHASTRALTQQQAEQQRFAELYEASARMSALVTLDRMLHTIAEEARTLTTGAAAVAVVVDADGAATGVVVDDAGARTPADAAVAAMVRHLDAVDAGAASTTDLPAPLMDELPRILSAVWTARRADDATLLLLVAREFAPDGNDDHRTDVLGAFASHAATLVANVRMHDEVQRALAQEQALSEQKTDFVAAVSHELRTPLASMAGVLQTLRRHQGRLPVTYEHELLDAGLEQGARLRRLIDDLLVVAAADHRTVTVSCARLDLADFADEVERELGARLDGRLRVTLEAGLRGRAIDTDVDKLRQIVHNLLENARKYAPTGPIELGVAADDERCVITIRDHGPGIPVAQHERVFDRFVQLDQSSTRREGGTGLGLHLARELANLLDGELSVESAPGGGARFILELPFAGNEHSDVGVAARQVGGPADDGSGAPMSARIGSIRRNPLRIGAYAAAGHDHAERPAPASTATVPTHLEVVPSVRSGGARND